MNTQDPLLRLLARFGEGNMENIRVADDLLVDLLFAANGRTYHLSRVLNGHAGISADMDLRLSEAYTDARSLAQDAGCLRFVAGATPTPQACAATA